MRTLSEVNRDISKCEALLDVAVTDAEVDKFSNADEESLQIFKEAKSLAAKENISFKEALLKLNI